MKKGGAPKGTGSNTVFNDKVFTHAVIKYSNLGIFEIHCLDDCVFEISDIREIHSFLEHCAGLLQEKVLVVSYSKNLTNIDLEAIKYISAGPHVAFIKAEAFVISSLPQKLVGNFFMKNFRPKVPAEVFVDKASALKWLLSFKKNRQE